MKITIDRAHWGTGDVIGRAKSCTKRSENVEEDDLCCCAMGFLLLASDPEKYPDKMTLWQAAFGGGIQTPLEDLLDKLDLNWFEISGKNDVYGAIELARREAVLTAYFDVRNIELEFIGELPKHEITRLAGDEA